MSKDLGWSESKSYEVRTRAKKRCSLPGAQAALPASLRGKLVNLIELGPRIKQGSYPSDLRIALGSPQFQKFNFGWALISCRDDNRADASGNIDLRLFPLVMPAF